MLRCNVVGSFFAVQKYIIFKAAFGWLGKLKNLNFQQKKKEKKEAFRILFSHSRFTTGEVRYNITNPSKISSEGNDFLQNDSK